MENEKAREISAWLLKAQNDLDAARLLSEADPPKRDIAVYHCQQSAEKAIKAWLVFRDIQFPKTHDLEKLLSLDLSNSPVLAQLTVHARILSPYAIEFRYPGDLNRYRTSNIDQKFQARRKLPFGFRHSRDDFRHNSHRIKDLWSLIGPAHLVVTSGWFSGGNNRSRSHGPHPFVTSEKRSVLRHVWTGRPRLIICIRKTCANLLIIREKRSLA